MGCCVAPGCSNSTRKGYKTYHFPTNPERQKLWLVRVKRDNWTPTKSSTLCEVHFESDQFVGGGEKRRRLSPNAVPTLFAYRKAINKRKSPTKRGILTSLKTPLEIDDHRYCKQSTSAPTSTDPNLANTSGLHVMAENKENVEPDQDDSGFPMDLELSVSLHDTPLRPVEEVVGPMELGFGVAKPCDCKQMSLVAKANHSKETLALKKRLEQKDREILLLKKQLQRNKKERDQILQAKAVKKRVRGHRGNIWTNDEIQRALQLKFACGQTGYTLLLEQGYELPSITTLYRRTEHFTFKPGLLHEVFDLLEVKVRTMKPKEKRCMVVLDEVSLKIGWNYDQKSGTCYGDVTLPNHEGPATHALAFMIGGVSSNWKQTVCYHFTPNSVDGVEYCHILKDINVKAKGIGLNLLGVNSDMGPSNQRMWR